MTVQIATSTASIPQNADVVRHRDRVLAVDWQWFVDVADRAFSDYVFTRSSAKRRVFVRVDFRYSIFDTCYFRDCTFDSCDFTGCRFVGTNFHGSTFTGCKFDYAIFERTLVDNSILDTGCPSVENLKLRFARTLRTNYQSLGDAASVNKAILVALDATEVHLLKAWRSNESYYRRKYKGIRRVKALVDWMEFTVLDALWGNGERPRKLVRSVMLLLCAIAVSDVLSHRDPRLVRSYVSALIASPQIFLGTIKSPFGGIITAGITFLRLVVFGLFVSILVRRFARR